MPSFCITHGVGAVVDAQQTGKIFRIGFLDGSTAAGSAVLVEAFLQELTKLGWIEGKNITIEYRFAENKGSEHLLELAAELVRLKVDLIVVTGTTATLAAKSATTTIPIVMTNAADPVGAGLVASLARPGGNVTGLSSLVDRAKYEKARDTQGRGPQAHPSWTSAVVGGGINRSPDERSQGCGCVPEAEIGGDRDSTDAKGLENAFKTAKQKQVGAIMTTTARSFFAERKRIVELAGKYRLPAIYFQKEFVDEGGLMSYGADYEDLFRKAAQYVDKILKGTKPADLPVQQATKFEFIINLKAAKQIGLTIPVGLLERANKVIK